MLSAASEKLQVNFRPFLWSSMQANVTMPLVVAAAAEPVSDIENKKGETSMTSRNLKRFAASLGTAAVVVAGMLFLGSGLTALAQSRDLAEAASAFAVSSAAPQLPSGARLVARLPLTGQPVTHMYTMSEYGRTFLYIGHGTYSFTTVDISEGQNPQVVHHAPGNLDPALYEQLFKSDSTEVSPSWEIVAGVDNLEGSGRRSVLESSDPNDAKLLRTLGPDYANLADRDHRLVYFAAPSQLLVVEDNNCCSQR
jgi:hypothetical protein